MHVAELWRYPVKSLAGETLESAVLTADGLAGDRVVHVRDRPGRGQPGRGALGPVTGRTRPGLLTVPARTGPDGVPLVAGHRWDSEAAAAVIRAQAGVTAELAAYSGPERFDIGNLLIATDGELDRFARRHGAPLDVRRLRPNLVLGGAPATAGADWPGAALVVGDAVIGIHSPRARCIVTSVDPDTGVADLDVFRRIRRDFDNLMALNAWVIRGGAVRVGDPVRVVPSSAQPTHLGGWVVGAPYAAS